MAPTSLSDFPAELILHISTKHGESTQRQSPNPVLSQSIDCFDLAQELVAVQGRSTGGQSEPHKGELERSNPLVANASMVLQDYIITSVPVPSLHHQEPVFVNPRERLAFTRSHYRVWTPFALFMDREAQELRLQAAALAELREMVKTVNWIQDREFHRDQAYILGGFKSSELWYTRDMIAATFKLRKYSLPLAFLKLVQRRHSKMLSMAEKSQGS